MKKTVLIAATFLLAFSASAQVDKIASLLNQQFATEQKMYDSDDPEKPTLVQPFRVEGDSLTVIVSIPFEINGEKSRNFRRSVHLKDITGFSKDYNIVFAAKENAVTELVTRKDENGSVLQTFSNRSHLFFTELRKDNKSKGLQQKMLAAFRKAGYEIKSEHWDR